MSNSFLTLIVRILTGVLDALNLKRKKDATDDVATTLSNGGTVLQSNLSFSDLASKNGCDKAE